MFTCAFENTKDYFLKYSSVSLCNYSYDVLFLSAFTHVSQFYFHSFFFPSFVFC